jgi:membrane protease YdiL (CAAX protease family)
VRIIGLVLVCTALASALAFRPEWGGTWKFWGTLLGVYGGLAAFAIYRMWDEGVLRDVFKLKGGDFALGALSALGLLVGAQLIKPLIAPPGTEQSAWLSYIYLCVGDPIELQRSVAMTIALLLIASFEEVVWRALVLDELMQRFGDRRAWPLCAVLYSISLLPTAFLLQGPAGPNPLLPLAALGCGLVWGFMANIFRRLPPLIVSHMVFTYFTATQFRLPGF